MRKIPYQFFLNIIASGVCLIWFLYPDKNLEPLIVLSLLVVSLSPLYWHEFGPWFDEFRLRKNSYHIVEAKDSINAIEGGFDKFEAGVDLQLKRQRCRNYPTVVKFFFEQTCFRLVAYFNNGDSIDITPSVEVGNSSEEVVLPKLTNKYAIVQFDVDNDGLDEILFCIIDSDNFHQSIQVCILKYYPPYFSSDVTRADNWYVYKEVVAHGVQNGVISLESGSITIKRNFRGLIYKWNIIDQDLLYTGSA